MITTSSGISMRETVTPPILPGSLYTPKSIQFLIKMNALLMQSYLDVVKINVGGVIILANS